MTFGQRKPGLKFLIAIGLVSGASLGYEILLMRIFSIIQWHHFAYLMISLALLGFGVSGTFITLLGDRLSRHFHRAFQLNLVLFSISSLGCFLIAQQVQFNPLEILWDKGQWINLAGIFLLLMLPFFFAANGICLAFMQYKRHINSVYAANLFGSGMGALAVILLLHWLFPLTLLGLISGLGFLAVALLQKPSILTLKGMIGLILAVLVPIFVIQSDLQLKPLEYKQLSQTMKQMGARVIAERSGPLALITVVESPKIPFRYAPGLSLMSPALPPDQLGLFFDGEGMTAITRYDGKQDSIAYLHEMPSALPYVLLDQPDVLILGAGGGASILQALWHGARQIDAVELNDDLVALMTADFADYSGRIYTHEKVSVHVEEARGFIETTQNQFDLIQMELMDSFNVSSAGLSALSETWLYTVESFQTLLQRLKPEGILAIGRWIRLPPRDGPRMLATVIEAMHRSGIDDPARRLVWIRSWNLGVLLIRNGAFSAADIASIKAFCIQRAFDLAWYPGISEKEVNRYNHLADPVFYQAAVALLGEERDRYIETNKFNITPVTDDKPWFFRFFRWRILPDVMNNIQTGGYSLLDLGYLVLVATLVLASVFSFLLILLPLFFKYRKWMQRCHESPLRVALYFSCLGFAFMFIEIAFMQRFSLYLSHPVLSAATMLTSFLVFAGIGSQWVGRGHHPYAKKRIMISVFVIVAIATLYLLVLPVIFRTSMTFPDTLRVLISILLIAPLAVFMGMPFPAGIARLENESGEKACRMVPWAWGVNGCASVIGAVLATLLATHFGISAVILIAMAFYLVALVLIPTQAGFTGGGENDRGRTV